MFVNLHNGPGHLELWSQGFRLRVPWNVLRKISSPSHRFRQWVNKLRVGGGPHKIRELQGRSRTAARAAARQAESFSLDCTTCSTGRTEPEGRESCSACSGAASRGFLLNCSTNVRTRSLSLCSSERHAFASANELPCVTLLKILSSHTGCEFLEGLISSPIYTETTCSYSASPCRFTSWFCKFQDKIFSSSDCAVLSRESEREEGVCVFDRFPL